MWDILKIKASSAIMKDWSISHGARNHLGREKKNRLVPSENKATDAEPLRDAACQPRV